MPTIAVTSCPVVAIYASDLENSRRFYEDHLGFALENTMEPGLLMRAGDALLYLEGGRQPRRQPAHEQPEVCAVFGTDSVLQAHQKLRDAGVELVGDLQNFTSDFAFFRAADPDGNVFEIAGKP